ncbi:MAG: rhomboid family intramembrane serine protease [Candidatus Limivivens sp.]|nr:rhomboid family intramembrane serine protease [Candidatus Limivivens sp.]
MDEIKTFLRSRSIVNLTIVVINIVVFFILDFLGNTEDAVFMANHGACYAPWVVEGGEYYRLFTSMFLHFGIQHLFNNMLCLIFLGDILEKLVGKARYLLIFFGGGLGSGAVSLIYELWSGKIAVSAGASGAIFAVIGALVFLAIVHRGSIPSVSRSRFYFMAALSVFQGFTSQGVDNAAHVGGFVLGFLLAAIFIGKRAVKQVPDLFEEDSRS